MKGFIGKLRGIVSHNDDPEKLLRIRAKVPAINSEVPLTWAFPCKDSLGKDNGDIELPGKGDGVWIEFEQTDSDYPIYVGMWASAKDVPTDFEHTEKQKLIKDKNGNIINMTKDGIEIESIGKVIIKSADTIELGEKALEKLIKGETFKDFFNGHKHFSSQGPTDIVIIKMDDKQLSENIFTGDNKE